MFLSLCLSSLLAISPHEFSVESSNQTPSYISSFGGVSITIDQNEFESIPLGADVILRQFPLGENSLVDLQLERFDAFTHDAKVVIGRTLKDGQIVERHMSRPDVVLLRGSIYKQPDTHVFLAFGENTTNGFVTTASETFVLTQHPELDTTFVYNITSVDPDKMNWAEFQCQVEDVILPERKQQVARSQVGDCLALQVAIETDWEFTGQLFSGDTSASGEYATTVVGAISSIYENDIDVAMHISYLRLWDAPNDPWTGSGTGPQLGEFREHWQEYMGDVPRHLAHMFSGRNLGGGMAYVGAVCSPHGYAVSANLNGYFPQPLEDYSYQNWDIMVIAHEQGHNCGTWHTHNYSPPIDNCGNGDCTDAYGGTIMSYCHTCSGGLSNVVLEFHPRVRETMENYLFNSISCSLECDQFLNGSCCFEDEMCEDLNEEECADAEGIFLGIGTFCATGGCEPDEPGACCIDDLGTCAELDANTCLFADGLFLGIGTTCDLGWCDPNAEFACCLGTECDEITQVDCENAGGQFDGIGTNCTDHCQPLHNDFCDTAFDVSTGVYNFSTYDAISDNTPVDNEMCITDYLGEVKADVWFKYEACETSELLVSMCGTVNFDSDLVVYNGSCEMLNQVGCNGDGAGCAGFTSELTLDVTEGDTYFIRVGGFNANSYGHGQIVFGGQQCSPDTPCQGDVDLDGFINITDVLLIIDHWGEFEGEYDINENGTVDLGDLLIVIASWGNCED